MTRAVSFAAALALALGFTAPSQGALIDRGNGMVYDSTRNVTWVTDANLFRTQVQEDSTLVDRIIGSRPILAVGSANYAGTMQIGRSNYGHGGSYVIDMEGNWHRFMSAGDFSAATGAMNWWGAQAWVEQLTYGGYTDWRLPTLDFCGAAWTCYGGELGGLLTELGASPGSSLASSHNESYALFSHVQPAMYWSGTGEGDYGALALHADSLMRGGPSKYSVYGLAWAVRDGDVGTVPEPAVPALFALGAAIAFGLRRHRS